MSRPDFDQWLVEWKAQCLSIIARLEAILARAGV